MQTAIEALKNLEDAAVSQDGPDGVFRGQFKDTWTTSERRERLLSVLRRLNDLPVVNAQVWPNYEVAITFDDGAGKALWVSYTGHSFNIWTNFGAPEAQFDFSSNIILHDEGEVDSRQTVVQVIRDYFKPELVEAA